MSNHIESQDRRQPVVVYFDIELDDMGLTPYEYRAYGRIARRASGGRGRCSESLDAMATGCQMSRPTLIRAINGLIERKMVARESNPGYTSVYYLTDKSEWVGGKREIQGVVNERAGGGKPQIQGVNLSLTTKYTNKEIEEENKEERESTHPAVEVALEFFPSLAFYHQDLIVNANIQRLDLWREACTAWRDNHYSTKNIAGLIDSYYRREALENRRSQNGQNGNRRISNGEQAALDTQRIVEQLLSGDPDTLRRFGCVDPTDESVAVAPRLLGR